MNWKNQGEKQILSQLIGSVLYRSVPLTRPICTGSTFGLSSTFTVSLSWLQVQQQRRTGPGCGAAALCPDRAPSLAGPAGGSPHPAVPRGSIPGLHHSPRGKQGHIWARDQCPREFGPRRAPPAAPSTSGRWARPERGAAAAHARARPAPAAGGALGWPRRGRSGVAGAPVGVLNPLGLSRSSRTAPVLPGTPQLNPSALRGHPSLRAGCPHGAGCSAVFAAVGVLGAFVPIRSDS